MQSEQAYEAALLEVIAAGGDPGREALRIVRRAGPLAEKVAALKVAYRSGVIDPLAEALGAEPDLEDFAARFLVGKAHADVRARALLLRYARDRSLDPAKRARALGAALQWAPEAELPGGISFLAGEADLEVVASAARALAQNEARGASSALAWLRFNHPSIEIRRRVDEEFQR